VCMTCALPMWTICLPKDSREFPAAMNTMVNGHFGCEPGLACHLDPGGFCVAGCPFFPRGNNAWMSYVLNL